MVVSCIGAWGSADMAGRGGSGAIHATEIIFSRGLVVVLALGAVTIWLKGLVAMQFMLRISLVVEVLWLFWLRRQCRYGSNGW